MNNKKIALLATGLVFTSLLAGCISDKSSDISSKTTTGNTMEYTAESWKTLIPESCSAFFDGCNYCNRAEGTDNMACTLKYCEKYEEPKCMDGEVTNQNEVQNTSGTIVSGKEYLGLTEEEALDLAQKNQDTFRIVERDGVSLPITMDLVSGRMNASVISGKVVNIFIE